MDNQETGKVWRNIFIMAAILLFLRVCLFDGDCHWKKGVPETPEPKTPFGY
jgi:hypothetical protein